MMVLKHIPLEKAFNVRDMGGIVNREGKALKWQKLIRSDGVANLTKQDWDTLYKVGVRTILDLRGPSENKEFPDQPPQEIVHISCPLQEEDFDIRNSSEGAAAAFQKSLLNSYTDMLFKTPYLLAKALCTLTDALENGAVLFHCTAGKDRTGTLAAAVLVLLGFDDPDIIADYQISRTYNRNGIDKFVETLPNAADFKTAMESNPETMMDTLEAMHQVDFAALMAGNGFSEEKLEKLKALLLTDIDSL